MLARLGIKDRPRFALLMLAIGGCIAYLFSMTLLLYIAFVIAIELLFRALRLIDRLEASRELAISIAKSTTSPDTTP